MSVFLRPWHEQIQGNSLPCRTRNNESQHTGADILMILHRILSFLSYGYFCGVVLKDGVLTVFAFFDTLLKMCFLFEENCLF